MRKAREAETLFSTVVGSKPDGKTQVVAKMFTTRDGTMIITYHEHPSDVEIQAGDFEWSREAMAFARGYGQLDNGANGLNEDTARSYIVGLKRGAKA